MPKKQKNISETHVNSDPTLFKEETMNQSGIVISPALIVIGVFFVALAVWEGSKDGKIKIPILSFFSGVILIIAGIVIFPYTMEIYKDAVEISKQKL